MHTDPELLSLLAIGDRDAGAPDAMAHIQTCARCSGEYESLREVGELARTVSDHLTLETPPAAVWERIRTELGLAPDFVSDLIPPPMVDPGSASRRLSVVPDESNGRATSPPPAEIDHPRPSGGAAARRALTLALVAVVAAIVGVGGTLLVQRWTAPRDTMLSATTLTALPAWAGSSGNAELEVDSEGRRWLVVWVEPVRPVDGLQQIWLINSDVTAMLQVGPLSYPGQRFLLPDNVDVSRYPVVDVSDEPPTDDGAHSGNSIVRGTLPL